MKPGRHPDYASFMLMSIGRPLTSTHRWRGQYQGNSARRARQQVATYLVLAVAQRLTAGDMTLIGSNILKRRRPTGHSCHLSFADESNWREIEGQLITCLSPLRLAPVGADSRISRAALSIRWIFRAHCGIRRRNRPRPYSAWSAIYARRIAER